MDDVTAAKRDNLDPTYTKTRFKYHSYTVFIGPTNIATIVTIGHDTAAKWLKQIEKIYRKKTGPVIVGLSTSTHGGAAHSSDGKICTDPKKIPYDLLQIAVGCQCLIYVLKGETKPFRSFFKNPNVIAVGVDIASVAKKLAS